MAAQHALAGGAQLRDRDANYASVYDLDGISWELPRDRDYRVGDLVQLVAVEDPAISGICRIPASEAEPVAMADLRPADDADLLQLCSDSMVGYRTDGSGAGVPSDRLTYATPDLSAGRVIWRAEAPERGAAPRAVAAVIELGEAQYFCAVDPAFNGFAHVAPDLDVPGTRAQLAQYGLAEAGFTSEGAPQCQPRLLALFFGKRVGNSVAIHLAGFGELPRDAALIELAGPVGGGCQGC